MGDVSDKNLNHNDLDDFDDLDVPTYDSATGTASESNKTEQLDRRDIYSAAGRTAPQTIEPTKAGSSKPHAGFGKPGGFGRKKPAATEAIDRPNDFQTANLRALDEQESTPGKYDESQDFASADSTEVGAGVGLGAAGAAGLGSTALLNDDTADVKTDDADVKTVKVRSEVEHRRGTINFGLLIARLVVGVLLLADSVAVLFKLGGNAGVTGLEGEFGSYYYANLLAWGVPSVELVVGVLLIVGLATPLAACLGMIPAMFMALHSLNQMDSLNVFALTADVKYWLAMSGFLVALQYTGPGLYGLDFGRGWARRPLASSWILAIVGFAAAGALWYFAGRTNPFN